MPDLWDVRATAGTRGLSLGFGAGRDALAQRFPPVRSFDERPPSQRRREDGGQRLNSDVRARQRLPRPRLRVRRRSAAARHVLRPEASFGIPPSTTQFAPMLLAQRPAAVLLHVQGGVDQRVLPNVGIAGGPFLHRLREATITQYDQPDFPRTVLLTTKAESSEVGGIGRIHGGHGRPAIRWTLAGQVRCDPGRRLQHRLGESLGTPKTATIASIGVENIYAAPPTGSASFSASATTCSVAPAAAHVRMVPDPAGYHLRRSRPVRWAPRAPPSRGKIRFPTLRELSDPWQGNSDLEPETKR